MARRKRQTDPKVLQEFVCFFESKGWLNRSIGIKSKDARYRLFCSESRFFAYRINESSGISPGVPGWPVCVVTRDNLFHDAETCAFPAGEMGNEEWLSLLTSGCFEVTQNT